MNWYLHVIRKYSDFEGRARRKEYWMFFFIHLVIGLSLVFIDNKIFGSDGIYYISGLYGLLTFLPKLAVTVRRLHDIDKSGYYYFVSCIPFIGGIWLLILECTEGTIGPNRFGVDPKNISFKESY